MPAKDRGAAFARLTDSAQLQAGLGDLSLRPAPAAPVALPVAEPAPATNGHAAAPTARKAKPEPEPAGQAAGRLAALQASRSRETVSRYGYTVAKPAGDEPTVQTTVRMPVTVREIIDAFCRDYDLTFQEFGMLAYEHLLETAQQARHKG
jgi:hypothetical protein